MDVPDLRPLSFGELLDRTFSYYRNHFWLFVGIMALPQVPIVAVSVLFSIIRSAAFPASAPARSPGSGPAPPAAAFAGGAILGLLVAMGAYFILYGLGLGATTFAISEIHLGRSSSIRSAYRSLRGRFWRMMDLIFTVGIRIFLIFVLVWVVFAVAIFGIAGLFGGIEGEGGGPVLAVVLVLFGILLLIGGLVLGIGMFLRYGCAVPALLLENLRVKDAIKRSVTLTKGNLGRVFLVVLLMTLVSWTVALLFQGPFLAATMLMGMKKMGPPPLWLSIGTNLAGGVGHALAGPLLVLGLALLYYDIRVRKEGFDLQVMMAVVDAAQPAAAILPPTVAATQPQLKKTSVLLVLLLCLVSLGLYVPIWYLRRKSAIDSLRSSEKLVNAVIALPIVFWIAAFALGFLWEPLRQSGMHLDESQLNVATSALSLGIGVSQLFLAFKVRRILEDHFNASHTGLFAQSMALPQGTSLSGVATFFLGILYLQHKINEFAEVWYQTPPSAAQDVVPAV